MGCTTSTGKTVDIYENISTSITDIKTIETPVKTKEVHYVKLTNKSCNHNGLQYKKGINVDPIEFNPTKPCGAGGIYFYEYKDAHRWYEYSTAVGKMYWIWDVTVPKSESISEFKNKSKAHSVILSNKRRLIDDTKLIIKIIRTNKCTHKNFDKCTEDMWLYFLKQNGNDLYYIKHQTEKLCLEAVKQNGLALKFVKKKTEEICLEAVKQNSEALQYVKKKTEEICLEAVKQNGWVLYHVKKQTEEICLEAVKQNGLVLQYVKKKTEEICLEAVKQNGMALQYVKHQTEEICLEAVKQNGYALDYVKYQTEEICLEAVKQNGHALDYVEEQMKEICLEAMKHKNS